MVDKRRAPQRRAGNGAAHDDAGNTAPPGNERHGSSFDNVLERWLFGVAKEGLTEELGTANAMLRGALAVREMQIETARQTQAAHEHAVEQMASARSLAELSSVGLMIAQRNAEGAVRYWSQFGAIVANSGLESWNAAAGACLRAQGIAQSLGQADTLEAQVEQLTLPVTSSPFAWPAQQAVREVMTLGARNWNEWVASAAPAVAKVVEAATAAPTPQH